MSGETWQPAQQAANAAIHGKTRRRSIRRRDIQRIHRAKPGVESSLTPRIAKIYISFRYMQYNFFLIGPALEFLKGFHGKPETKAGLLRFLPKVWLRCPILLCFRIDCRLTSGRRSTTIPGEIRFMAKSVNKVILLGNVGKD